MENKNYRIVYKVLDRKDPDYGKDRAETHHAQPDNHLDTILEEFGKIKNILKLKFVDEYPLGGLHKEGYTRIYDYRYD
jgi:hypothetical protein